MLNRANPVWSVIATALLMLLSDPGCRRAEAGTSAADTKTFSGISRAVWNQVREISSKDNGTRYEPAREDRGKAKTDVVILGRVELDFTYDETKQTITYVITKKPDLVSANMIWSGIQKTIDRARN